MTTRSPGRSCGTSTCSTNASNTSRFEVSFAGREDRTLPGRIELELPGIFSWALRGWVDLRQTGHFVEPASSRDVLAEAEQVFSPIAAFVDECCDVDLGLQVGIDAVWNVWQPWCKKMGLQPGSRAKLGTDLRACLPGINRRQIRIGGYRPYAYVGLDLNGYGKNLAEQWLRTEYRRA